MLPARRRLADVDYEAPWDNDQTFDGGNNKEIESLIQQLIAAKGDEATKKNERKRIRQRLRSLGHYGGLRQRVNDIVRGDARRSAKPIVVAGPATNLLPDIKLLPPITNAEAFLTRVRSLTGLPERNHEDVVKELLLRLGHDDSAIVFQRGRIDLSILGEERKTIAIVEVKRTIAAASERLSARRQGMDYASQTGALIIIITDGDRYEIYDRRKGLDYDGMLCGRFQLTAFFPGDVTALDQLRPECLNSASI